MHRARTLASFEEEQKLDIEKVKHDLKLNNYPSWFINQEMVPKSNEKETNFKASVVLPHFPNLEQQPRCILKEHKIQYFFKLSKKIGHFFPPSKDKIDEI